MRSISLLLKNTVRIIDQINQVLEINNPRIANILNSSAKKSSNEIKLLNYLAQISLNEASNIRAAYLKAQENIKFNQTIISRLEKNFDDTADIIQTIRNSSDELNNLYRELAEINKNLEFRSKLIFKNEELAPAVLPFLRIFDQTDLDNSLAQKSLELIQNINFLQDPQNKLILTGQLELVNQHINAINYKFKFEFKTNPPEFDLKYDLEDINILIIQKTRELAELNKNSAEFNFLIIQESSTQNKEKDQERINCLVSLLKEEDQKILDLQKNIEILKSTKFLINLNSKKAVLENKLNLKKFQDDLELCEKSKLYLVNREKISELNSLLLYKQKEICETKIREIELAIKKSATSSTYNSSHEEFLNLIDTKSDDLEATNAKILKLKNINQQLQNNLDNYRKTQKNPELLIINAAYQILRSSLLNNLKKFDEHKYYKNNRLFNLSKKSQLRQAQFLRLKAQEQEIFNDPNLSILKKYLKLRNLIKKMIQEIQKSHSSIFLCKSRLSEACKISLNKDRKLLSYIRSEMQLLRPQTNSNKQKMRS